MKIRAAANERDQPSVRKTDPCVMVIICYDATGALHDMVPSHLFQLLTLAAMEPPIPRDGREWRKLVAEFKPHSTETQDGIVEYA